MRAGRDGRMSDSPPATYRVLDAISQPRVDSDDVARIVRRAQRGDDLAFAELYVHLFARVCRYLQLTLKNRDDAQDAAQDVFVKVFKAIDRYEADRGSFESWLFSMVRNLAADRLRHMRRGEAIPPTVLAAPPTTVHERAASLLERLDPEGGARAMIDALPDGQRRALVLLFVFDFSTADAADVLGTTPEAVRQLQHRGLKTLGRELALRPEPAEHAAACYA